MSVRTSVAYFPVVSANSPVFREVFIRHVHDLLCRGHHRLNQRSLAALEEPEVTGRLVRAMREETDDPQCPEWISRNLAVHDEEPIYTGSRQGMARRRVDISFESCNYTPRPRMQFEAKRLHSNKSVSQYVGEDGLGSFLAGEDAYARDHPDAGMIGYVQQYDQHTWAKRISARLQAHRREFAIPAGGNWQSVELLPNIQGTYRTRHSRPAPQGQISIYHVLLMCH
jgi:hypothetical protein